MRPRLLVLGVLLVAALTGCSLQTLGAPTGSTTLNATFDDAQNLVTGHSVQMSDVKVGTVTGVKLIAGYKVRVTMSIKDGVKIPVGTSAEIAVTSLLGENFVRLTLPPGQDMATGPFMASGTAFQQTSVQPAFEQVVGNAGKLLNALAGDDLGTIVEAGSTALGGNGQRLNTLIAKSTALVDIFARQREQLGLAVDDFAKLGRTLATRQDVLSQAPGELQKTTQLLDQNKARILTAIQKITEVSQQLNDKVLVGRMGTLRQLIDEIDPVIAQLGGERTRLTGLVNGLESFVATLPKATYDGQVLLYAVLKFVLPGQKNPYGVPQSKSSKTSQPQIQIPDPLKSILPNIGGAN